MAEPYLLVEMWEPKEGGWEKLSREQRKNIIDMIQTGIANLIAEGLQSLGFFVNDPTEGKYREHWRFVAVWRLPSKELLDKMLPQVETLPGWFDYMHELRVWGQIQTPAQGADVLINWGSPTIMGRFEALEASLLTLGDKLAPLATLGDRLTEMSTTLKTIDTNQGEIVHTLDRVSETLNRIDQRSSSIGINQRDIAHTLDRVSETLNRIDQRSSSSAPLGDQEIPDDSSLNRPGEQSSSSRSGYSGNY